MAQNELNKLYPGGARFEDLANSLKSNKSNLGKLRPILGQSLWAVPTAVAVSKVPLELRKYFKSLGDYGGRSLEITGNKLDKEEARRIIKDFNSLYFGGNKDVDSGVKNPQDVIGAIDYKESQPKAKKEEPKQTNYNQYQFDPVTGLPILPEEVIGWDDKGNSSTQPPAQNKAVGYTQPAQQTSQQPQQSGRTIDDIIDLAQAQHQLRNEQMVPYIEALQEAMDKYGANKESNFKRDLSLASLAGMTKNPAYSKMIGLYDENQPMEKRLALQQQLAGLKQQQLFDPTQIYGNAELVKRLGLSPEAALANPEVLKQYANIYNYGLDYNAVLARLKQQEEQNKLDRELKWLTHMNPQYNTLASQAQLGSSILSSMQSSPALRNAMTPEMVQYLISLTGFKPGSVPTSIQQPAQNQLVDDIIDYNASLRGR